MGTKNKKSGFTMVELVVAIAILGVLTLIALPTIRAIQANNKKAKFVAYEKSIAASSKLYVDSYGEDLYGRNHTGCAIIYYKDLKDRDLVEDIQLKNTDCGKDDTYIIVKRPKNKNDHYFPHLTCREKNTIVYGDEAPATLDDSCKIEDGKGPIITVKDKSPYASNPHYKKDQQPRINVKIEDAGIGLMADQQLNYQWYKNDVKQGSQQILKFGNIDFDTDKNKDIPNLSEMVSTLEDTTYKVVITGTVKDYDGNETPANFTMTIKYHNTKIFIKIHPNGGKLTEEYDHKYAISTTTGLLTYNGSENIHTLWYGEKLTSNGLVNVDNPTHLNLTKTGFIPFKDKEFNTKADGTGKDFNQKDAYKASDFCNADNDNCTAVLYVKWDDAVYNLTYDDDGGTGCSTKKIEQKYNKPWGALCKPSKTGHVFGGWYDGTTKVDENSKALKDVKVKAKWTPETYQLTISCPNTTCSCCGSKTGSYGSTWGTLCTPTRTGYSFVGWYDGTTKIAETTKITGPRTITCTMKAAEYKLTYDDNGGTGCSDKSITKTHGQAWGTLCEPTRTGYKFTGWTNLSSTTAVKNEKVKASWTPNTYKLTYSCSYGSCTSKNGLYDSKWGELCTPPAQTGYDYNGWYDGTTQVTADTKVTGNRTVTCKYTKKQYKLTYEDGGLGCNGKTITKNYLEKWGTLCTPSKTGYTFNYWYDKADGTTKVTADTQAKKNITIKPKLTANSYTLTYSCSYGSCTSKSGTYDSAWGTLCTPARTGYDFSAWKDGTTTVTKDTIVKGNRTVKCNHTPKKYTLTYSCDGSTNCTTTTGNYDSTWGTLCTPKKTGYKFNAWKDGSTTVTSSTKVTGNRTVKCDMTKVDLKPAKPTITNSHSGKWVNSSYAITAKTTTAASSLGYWYYSYDQKSLGYLKDSKGNNANGVDSVTTQKYGQMNKTVYVRVCSIYASSSTDAKNCSDFASTTIQIDLTRPVMRTVNKSGSKWVFAYEPQMRKPVSKGVTIESKKCAKKASNNADYTDDICLQWSWWYKKVPYYNGEFWWGWDDIVCYDAGGSGKNKEYWMWDHEGKKSPKWCKWNKKLSTGTKFNTTNCNKVKKETAYDHNFFAGNDRPHYKHGTVYCTDKAGNTSDTFDYRLDVKYKGE